MQVNAHSGYAFFNRWDSKKHRPKEHLQADFKAWPFYLRRF